MKSFKGASQIIDAKKNLVLPGFAVGHTHIYSTFARGLNLPFNPLNFKDILNQLWWKLDSKLGERENYYSALISGIEFIKNGVTTVIDHHASGLQIKGSLKTLKNALCDEIGLRGIFCFETSDRFNIDECIEENLDFLCTRSEMHAGIFGLHASLSLSDDTLEKISKLYKGPILLFYCQKVYSNFQNNSHSQKYLHLLLLSYYYLLIKLPLFFLTNLSSSIIKAPFLNTFSIFPFI